MMAALRVEVHHRAPRCLLGLRDRADAAGFTGEGIELAMDYEHEAMRWGMDPDISREELAALVDASTVEIPAHDHRHTHAEDFRRWGRRGGRRTLALYGAPWFAALAARRWNRISAEALSEMFEKMGGRS